LPVRFAKIAARGREADHASVVTASPSDVRKLRRLRSTPAGRRRPTPRASLVEAANDDVVVKR